MEQKLNQSQKVLLQNLLTINVQAQQATSLYLSQVAKDEWGYTEDTLPKLQFDLQKLEEGVVVVLEQPAEGRQRKNKK